MDRAEMTREQKIESMKNYNQSNEDFWTVFPNCEKCNAGHYVTTIPNKNPVLDIVAVKFPNCNKCNTDKSHVYYEKEI